MIPWQGRPTDTNQKKVPHTLCRKALSFVTLGYFQPHLHPGKTTVSTVSSLTTKDNRDKSQGPLNLKIALLTTMNARFSIVNRAFQVIYVAVTCIRSAPSFSCFAVTCHNESETVVSRNTSDIAWMTAETGVPRCKLETSHSVTSPLAAVSVIPSGTYQWHKTVSHSSFWKPWKPSREINHSIGLLKCPVQTRPARIFEEPTQGGYCLHVQINDTIQWFNTICQVKLFQSSCAHLKWCLARMAIHKSAAAYFHPIKRVK